MTTAIEQHVRIQTMCLLAVAAVALGAGLYWLAPVMVPFVLAFFLTVVLTPVAEFLRRTLHLPFYLAVAASAGLGVVLLVLLGGLLSRSIVELEDNRDAYVARIEEIREWATGFEIVRVLGIQPAEEPGGARLPDGSPLDEPVEGPAPGLPETPQVISPGVIREIVGDTTRALIGVVSQGVLVLIFMMFLLTGRAHSGTLGDVESRIKGYVVTKVVVSSITGVLVWLCLTVLGIDMALVFGVFAFLLNFVPSVGSVIATLLPLPVVLFGDHPVLVQVLAFALPGLVQFVIGNVLEPKMLGDSMDLHPVTILLALIFWGMIWGVVGTLLATPITAVVKILFEKEPFTRPVAELMAGRFPSGSPFPVRSPTSS